MYLLLILLLTYSLILCLIDLKTLKGEEYPKQKQTNVSTFQNPSILDCHSKNKKYIWDTKPINPAFCLACDTMFVDRPTLEDHTCPFVSYICSCGISFHNYSDMWAHSSFHNHKPSFHQSHISAMENRNTAIKEQELKLKILEETAKNLGLVQNSTNCTTLPRAKPRFTTGKTKNMWWRFKPVVKLEKLSRFGHREKYVCTICQKEEHAQDQLIKHVDTHSKTVIYGCNHCGLLLIGTVPPKPYHRCGLTHLNPCERFTTGQVQKDPLIAVFYPCPYCTIKFGHPGTLRNHININHSNITEIQETSTPMSHLPPQVFQESLQSVQKGTPNLWCTFCGKTNDSNQVLGLHRCKVRPSLLKLEDVKQEQQQPVVYQAKPSCSEVMFQFQNNDNLKTNNRTNRLNIKTDPLEVNVTMTQTEFSQKVACKTDHDLNNDVEKKGSTVLQSPNTCAVKSEPLFFW